MPRDAVADRPVPMKPSSLPTSAAPAGFATRALLLLAAEGASVAFFLRTLRGARWLPAFIGRNEISPPGREQLATWVLGGAVVPVVVAALALGSAWRKGGRDAFAARAEGALQLARLLSVSLVLWAIPPMMSVAAWRDRDLAFLICAAALVVGFERALCCSLGAAEDLQLVRPLRDGALRAWSRVSARVRSAAPHAIVATMVASFVGYMGHYTWLQHLRRQTSGFDLGYFATFFWNTLHGRPFYCPITHPRAGSLPVHPLRARRLPTGAPLRPATRRVDAGHLAIGLARSVGSALVSHRASPPRQRLARRRGRWGVYSIPAPTRRTSPTSTSSRSRPSSSSGRRTSSSRSAGSRSGRSWSWRSCAGKTCPSEASASGSRSCSAAAAGAPAPRSSRSRPAISWRPSSSSCHASVMPRSSTSTRSW